MPQKITIIGAGNVGSTAAHCCLRLELGEVVLLDVGADIPSGKALDLAQAAALEGHEARIKGTADYADSRASDVVVITAGVARKPGMSRADLLHININIVEQVMVKAMEHSPQALFVIASNPVDVICRAALKSSGLPAPRIIGLAGLLDAARMRAELAALAGVPVHEVQGVVIGEHGENMLPLPRLATIGGVPATSLLNTGQLEQVSQNTVSGGARIVSLMGCSAFYAPGMALALMVKALLSDSKAIMPCSAYLKKHYGAEDIFMCVPVHLGADGVEEIIQLELNAEEKNKLAASISNIRAGVQQALNATAGRFLN